MPQLIGLSGYARSGKDSAALALIEDGWDRRAFADTLRRFLYELNPIVCLPNGTRLADIVRSYGWEKAKAIPEVRGLLQRCGTEAGRQVIGPTVWIDATLRDLGETPVVVTDVRFVNEADTIRALGGLVVRVERPGFEPPVQSDGTVHPSETSLDAYPFDVVLTNDGSLSDLYRDIRSVKSYFLSEVM